MTKSLTLDELALASVLTVKKRHRQEVIIQIIQTQKTIPQIRLMTPQR